MRPGEYAQLDATALRALIVDGELHPSEVEAVAMLAIASVDGDLNAIAGEMLEPALDSDASGAFGGVPFLIKDSAPFARGVSFTLGSRAIAGAVAPADHPLMTAFRQAGLVTLGRTTAPELSFNFATESRLFGVTRNPWALDRGAGGSSGGAAALVAAGAVPMAHASDGAGSIRVPASACGVVGFAPGRGSTGTPAPVIAGASTSVDFVLTRTVRDTAAMFGLLSGVDVELARSPGRLRVGTGAVAASGVAVDPQVSAATALVASTLEWIGHDVMPATTTYRADDVVEALMLGVMTSARAILAAPRIPDTQRFEGVSRRILADALHWTADAAATAVAAQHAVTAAVEAYFERHDLLVTPTIAQLPARHGSLDYDNAEYSTRGWLRHMLAFGPFTAAYNVSGHPAISLPLAESREGLPIGVQLVAGRGREALLLRVAAQLEQALPWSARQPSTFVD